jgi:CubicO group peptidase (beta-lactamase class C family)
MHAVLGSRLVADGRVQPESPCHSRQISLAAYARRAIALLAVLLAACHVRLPNGAGTETRIQRVLAGLHTKRSVEDVPAETWTLGERMVHYRVPAVSVAVIHEDRIEWARAYGRTSAKGGRAASPETLFQAASISKPLTAFAVLRVADRGLLSLDDPANRYLRTWRLPDSPEGRSNSVSIALLIGHMSGLDVASFPGYAPGTAIPTLEQILDGVAPANTPPIRIVGLPGSKWMYSGGGYLVLQQVLMDVLGLGFPRLMEDLALAPTGMTHSTFEQPLPATWQRQAAVGHRDDGEPVAGRWHVYPELAAAGLWTTASDLSRFTLAVQAAANGRPGALLSSRSAEALAVPRFGGSSLGLIVRHNADQRWFTFNGGNDGYRALMYAYLTAGEGAVVMTNSDAGMALASEIINSIAREYRWPAFVPEELLGPGKSR